MNYFMSGASLLALSLAGAASAQELSYGGFSASMGNYTAGPTDVDTTVFSGNVGVQVQDFDFWISGTNATLDIGLPVDLSADALTFGAGYSFNDFRVDVSNTDLDLSIGPLGIGGGITEIGFAYDNGTYFGRLGYGQVDEDFLGDVSTTGLLVGYRLTERAEVALSIHNIDEPSSTLDKPIYILSANYDGGQWGVELDALNADLGIAKVSVTSLGANYDINDTWSIYGNYAQADLDILEATSMRLGGAYNTGAYTIFADYSISEIDGAPDDLRGVTFGFTMDFGSKPTSHETTADRLGGVLGSIAGYQF